VGGVEFFAGMFVGIGLGNCKPSNNYSSPSSVFLFYRPTVYARTRLLPTINRTLLSFNTGEKLIFPIGIQRYKVRVSDYEDGNF